MKFTMPVLAVLDAVLLVASQSLYTVDQRQYAIRFQLGEIIETQSNAGLYAKIPLMQNIKFYDKRTLLLDNSDPDRITTSEKKPLLVDFFVLWRIVDVKQYYISVQGDEEAARRRLSQTVRSNLAEEINKRTVHDAISGERDKIMNTTRQKADLDAKSIGVEIVDVRLRRVELPPDVTSCARRARPNPRRSAPMPTASAPSSSPTPIATRRRSRATATPRRRRSMRRPTARTPSSTRSTAASKPTRGRSGTRAT